MTIAESDRIKCSNTYRGNTNKSFKKLTEIEKKQIEFLGLIHRAKHKAQILTDLRLIRNAILSNCAYHEKNIEQQFKKLDGLSIPKEERDIISDSYDLSVALGETLMNDLKKVIDYAKKNDR